MSLSDDTFPLDIVLPVHNEGASIAQTLIEFHDQAQKDQIPIRFVICEDGSKDNTVEVIRSLESRLPILFLTSPERKGYSKAVIDGFRASRSDRVGFIDSDGQCDPRDLKSLVDAMNQNSHLDLVMGYRNPRSDHWIRLLMSGLFKGVYSFFFKVPVRDPSCPYLLIRKPALSQILGGQVGILKQGFWWEFIARAVALRLKLIELPVHHRNRSSGVTQVYRVSQVPKIAFQHLLGLFTLKRELSKISKNG